MVSRPQLKSQTDQADIDALLAACAEARRKATLAGANLAKTSLRGVVRYSAAAVWLKDSSPAEIRAILIP
jgi:hypothetical protein